MRRVPRTNMSRTDWQKGAYKMFPREPCANCSGRRCLKVSGHMQSKPRSISSIAARPPHSVTRHPLKHGQENDLTLNICALLEKLAMYTSHQKRGRNGRRNLAHADSLDTHRGHVTTSYGIPIDVW